MTEIVEHLKAVRLTGPDHEPLPFVRSTPSILTIIADYEPRQRSMLPNLLTAVMALTLTAVVAFATYGMRPELGEGRSTYTAPSKR